MGHIIEISDELFARMQAFAAPLVDTPETIISRALAALEFGVDTGPPGRRFRSQILQSGSASEIPSHTTPRRMVLAGTGASSVRNLLEHPDAGDDPEGARRGTDPQQIHSALSVNSVVGEKDFNGYKFSST